MPVKVTAYCMKCRAKREMKDPEAIVHPNGKDATRGTCPKCGTAIYRMGKVEGLEAAAPAKSSKKSGSKRTKVKVN